MKRHRSTDLLRIAYPGQKFNFTYLAANNLFSKLIDIDSFQLFQCDSLQEVFESVVYNKYSYGVIPIESSSHGTMHNVYDKLLSSDDINIVGEIGSTEQHCLCVKGTISENEIVSIIGHPHILECCSEYLDYLDKLHENRINRIGSWDSAAACSQVANDKSNKFIAAIGSKEASSYYGLNVLKSGIGNDQNAQTRYIIIASIDKVSKAVIDPIDLVSQRLSRSLSGIIKKSSLVIALRNATGAIFKMSSCFALRDINIFKIESRPATTAMKLHNLPVELFPYTTQHWNLLFYVDYEPSVNPETNKSLLNNLKEYSIWIRELGFYTSGLENIEAKPTNWNQIIDVISIA